MSRVRSPNYPAISLADAVERVARVFAAERNHPMARQVLVKGLGFGGINGSSLSALSAVVKYGLVDKDGESYKVSARAAAILHPHNDAEKQEAIEAAAKSPALFAELLEYFKGPSLPSDANLRAYLVRRNFSEGALDGVILSFRETMSIVSPQGTEPGENHAKQSALAITPASDPIHALQKKSANDALNARAPDVHLSQARPQSVPMVVQFDGTQLTVSATLEYADAVDKLIRILEANKPLLPEKRNARPDEGVTVAGDKVAA